MAPTGGAGGRGRANIKVVVRVRPFNNRELDRNAKCIVQMKDAQTILHPPPEAEERLRKSSKAGLEAERTFKYDRSYWSFDRVDPHYAGQDDLHKDLGLPLLDNAFEGYNNCIFAYGQTGSGKSYSMMGYGKEMGVIPKICRDMFERVSSLQADPHLTCTVEVSYLEIYNERVRDLLNPSTKGNLRVREHPSTGPYVEDLAKLAVRSFSEIENLMDEGNKARTVAATNMNETSSRSHAVFTLTLTQKRHDVETRMDSERVAKISLVDLAGSERATSTGATGARLKEGAEINRSLSTLGRVIATLADLSSGKKGMKVPYRDSVLTWLLKDSLGGNSMTAMIATISPADINFEETLSTLRYADSAKRIKNHAVVNEDPNARMIRELKEELALLRSKLGAGIGGTGVSSDIYPPGTPLDQQFVTITQSDGTVKRVSKAEIMEQLSQSEKLYRDLNQTWEEKLQETERIQKEREAALEELGISIEKGNVVVTTPKKMPHLVNLSDDPLLAERLVYNLKPGLTTVGNVDGQSNSEIRLSGSKILDEHCRLENIENVVTIVPHEGADILVNGIPVNAAKRLRSGNRIILGSFHIFRFNNPLEAKAERAEQSLLRQSVTASQLNSPIPYRPGHERTTSKPRSDLEYDSSRSESPMLRGGDSDWSFARREAAGALLGSDYKITNLTDDELNALFENVQRAREERRTRPEGHLFEQDEDSDDLSSYLVRDKYMSNGTIDDFSLDTAMMLPGTPLQEPTTETESKKIAKIDQESTQAQEADQSNQLPTGLAYSAVDDPGDAQSQSAKIEAAVEAARQEFAEQLRRQREEYENQIKQITPVRISHMPRSSVTGFFELSSAELVVARSVIEKWQQGNYIRLAESMMQNSGSLKEAEVMSKIMDKNTSFQFAILGTGQDKPSAYDLILHDIASDDDDALADASKPCLAVRVIDKKHSVIYLWSLDKLRKRILKMRQMQQYMDRPEYLQHFKIQNPFSESFEPLFSFIGDGNLPLTAVSEMRVQDFSVDIISPYTQSPIAKMRLSLEPSAVEGPPSTLNFNIVLHSMSGFAEHEGTNVHAQMHVPGSSEGDNMATTQTMNGFGEGPVRFESIHNLSINKEVVRGSYLKIAIYAQVTTMHLDKLTSWDELRNLADNPPDATQAPRLPESEYQTEERHDVFAKLQMLELAENGQYMPVEVVQPDVLDDGIHQLHQGLQRRLKISLTYSLTESLPWDDLAALRVGDIHLLDPRGKILDLDSTTPEIKLKQVQEPMLNDNADGTSTVTIIGQWDSSLHKSLYLDRATSEQYKVQIKVSWDIVSSRLEKKMSFSIEQFVQILPRSYLRSQSILKAFWNQTRVTHSTNGLFSITVRPLNAKKATDLWRLNTAKDYINGEELLETWKPRGISLVKDYMVARQKSRQLQDIEASKAIIGARGLTPRKAKRLSRTQPPPVALDTRQEDLLRKYVALWKKPNPSMTHPIFDEKHDQAQKITPAPTPQPSSSSIVAEASSTNSSPSKNPLSKTRYLAVVLHVPKNPVSLKSGYLLMPSEHASSGGLQQTMQWKRRFIDLRPPYLHVHSVPDGDAINAINLTRARIDADPDFVRLLGGVTRDHHNGSSSGSGSGSLAHVFAVYGEQNTFLFAARNESQKSEWILKIDQSYVEADDDGLDDDVF